ncbi:MAG: hypothetical protein AAFQ73_08385 [Pseudomonadota bacterium]
MFEDVNNRYPTPAEIDRYVSEARKLRADAMRDAFKALARSMTLSKQRRDEKPATSAVRPGAVSAA